MKKIYSLLSLCFFFAVPACNPMHEDIQDTLCSGIHSKSESGYCHGTMNRFPGGSCSEANCHGSTLTGGNTGGPSCYKCHGNRWAVWQTHTINLDGDLHHRDILCSVAGTNEQKCGSAGCHGPGLGGGTGYESGPACTLCHENTPTECSDGDD